MNENKGIGLGGLALSQLLGPRAAAAPEAVKPLAPKKPHFPSKAKSVIYLFMAGPARKKAPPGEKPAGPIFDSEHL